MRPPGSPMAATKLVKAGMLSWRNVTPTGPALPGRSSVEEGLRPLAVVDARHPERVLSALREALFHDGPAILPRTPDDVGNQTSPSQVPRAVSVVIETSGTTGKPKRVALSKDALLAAAQMHLHALDERFSGASGGTWWLVLPTTYIAGLQVLVRSLVAGTNPVAAPAGGFGPQTLMGALPELKGAKKRGRLFTSMVPAQLSKLIDSAESSLEVAEALRLFDAVLVGGQAIPRDLIERATILGLTVIRTYGSAETAGGCVWDGFPLHGVTVAVIDGRVAIAGPHLATSYLGDPERTAEHFVEHSGTHWFVSDDLGEVDPSGQVRIHGRIDDVIVSGGVKVDLAAVERALREDLAIGEVVVVAGSHDTWGQVPVVVAAHELDLEAIRQRIGTRLGSAARPDRVVVLPALPVLPSGKVDRVRLARLVSASPG